MELTKSVVDFDFGFSGWYDLNGFFGVVDFDFRFSGWFDLNGILGWFCCSGKKADSRELNNTVVARSRSSPVSIVARLDRRCPSLLQSVGEDVPIIGILPDVPRRSKEVVHDRVGDYLFAEKPYFFIGVVWLELLFLSPFSIVNIFGILCSRPWFNTTCLIYDISIATPITTLLGELMGSRKASEKLIMMYSPSMGLGVLAFLCGLILCSSKTSLALSKRSTCFA
ncbi:hypothetical protein Dsin_002636 [Dipteronia sinensis]|uniref:EXPERA domain-containing protein n=1 Tax=Dipteronia sinensis TaxID=43782 RepID=A0AAE0ELF0_9ROSI|nr:hypothetical protein Dsin_002636 [Dipteronia sinensis]